MHTTFLTTAKKQFEYYKHLGEKTFEQLNDDQLFIQYNKESNSIATIVNHMHGNMLSRWTDFLITDGEKEWRNRESEFTNSFLTREEMIAKWNDGWQCLFFALDALEDADLADIIFIRNQGHSVLEAILRQLAHYPYHVGQIVYVGKMIKDQDWKSLSIARGESAVYNQTHFLKPKEIVHFTDDLLREEEK